MHTFDVDTRPRGVTEPRKPTHFTPQRWWEHLPIFYDVLMGARTYIIVRIVYFDICAANDARVYLIIQCQMNMVLGVPSLHILMHECCCRCDLTAGCSATWGVLAPFAMPMRIWDAWTKMFRNIADHIGDCFWCCSWSYQSIYSYMVLSIYHIYHEYIIM